MIDDVEGRVAIVTGAASGIGRATAERFARAGMKVVLADIEEPRLNEVRASMAEDGRDVLAVPTDVSKGDSMEQLAEKALAAYGAIHLVHLNAGVAGGGMLWTATEKDWQWVLGVNLWGVIQGVRVFVPQMIAQDDVGHVVITASMAGLTTNAFLGTYNVSKHGAVAIAETLFREFAMAAPKLGVSVLCPGWVNTRIGEAGRNRPEELANPGVGGQGDIGGGGLKGVLEGGLAPADVADRVFEAVTEGRFYILTHPTWKPLIESRMHDILEERDPSPTSFPM